MANPRPAMYGSYHVYPLSGCGISMQLIPHLVGAPAGVTLCESGSPDDIVLKL